MTVHLRRGHSAVDNFHAPVPGTGVTCYVGVRRTDPSVWTYSLWGDDMISQGQVDMSGMESMPPDQFARAMYLCDVVYAEWSGT
jgi:hypothetical protein